MGNREAYVVDEVTAMSTMDAYYWLKMAREIDQGKLQKGQPDPLRGYPDLDNYPDEPSLLAHFIRFSTRFTDGDYYRGALLLPPLLAGLFVFPLFLYFNALGFGASTVLGGLIGTFSIAYYSRSDIGYIDTDMLNTFFPLAIAALIVLIAKERPSRTNLLLSGGAGAAMYLFIWWYQQPGFFLVFLPFIATWLLFHRLPLKQVAWILAVFSLCSGPHYVLQSLTSLFGFFHAYFIPKTSGLVAWPDIFATIQEAKQYDLTSKLTRLHGLPVVLAGFAGIGYLYFFRWKQMIPITPIVIIGLWSLVGPRRFAMYLAPFIGIGVGVLIELLVKQICSKFKPPQFTAPAIAMSLMAVLFFATRGYTAYHVVPGPMPDTATIRSILEIKRRVPANSAMFAWWDMGYPLMEIGEFATYHDGALHGYSRTTLAGKALTSPHQEEMVALLAYLEANGFDPLHEAIMEKNLSGDQVMELIFGLSPEFRGGNVYVFYTGDMINKFNGISFSGTWDFNKRASDPMTYQNLTCFSLTNEILTCRGCRVEINRGVITDGSREVPLKSVIFVNDGQIINRRDYSVVEGEYLQVLMRRNEVKEVQVIDKRLYLTNFNQQFVLGNYDRRYFEEVYNDFPVARVLRVKKVEELER